jgi:hypothetical protein
MVRIDSDLRSKLQEARISTLHAGVFDLPADTVFEPPCSLKWMRAEHSLRLGAFLLRSEWLLFRRVHWTIRFDRRTGSGGTRQPSRAMGQHVAGVLSKLSGCPEFSGAGSCKLQDKSPLHRGKDNHHRQRRLYRTRRFSCAGRYDRRWRSHRGRRRGHQGRASVCHRRGQPGSRQRGSVRRRYHGTNATYQMVGLRLLGFIRGSGSRPSAVS